MQPEAITALIGQDRAAAGRALDTALRQSHDSGTAADMLALHRVAAAYWAGDTERAAFHRTHAYVYALEAGDWAAADCFYSALATEGRV